MENEVFSVCRVWLVIFPFCLTHIFLSCFILSAQIFLPLWLCEEVEGLLQVCIDIAHTAFRLIRPHVPKIFVCLFCGFATEWK